jgi:hypothetical protein
MVPVECNYPIHDKEMLAVMQCLEEWRAELEGLQSQISIYTDYWALEYFMTTKQLSSRQVNWAEYLSRFNFLICYWSGRQNELADALSQQDKMVKAQNLLKDTF